MINGKKPEVLQPFFIDSRAAQEEGIIFGPKPFLAATLRLRLHFLVSQTESTEIIYFVKRDCRIEHRSNYLNAKPEMNYVER
jgi:hypothetical protein